MDLCWRHSAECLLEEDRRWLWNTRRNFGSEQRSQEGRFRTQATGSGCIRTLSLNCTQHCLEEQSESSRFRKRPCEHHATAAGEDILSAVKLVCNRRADDLRAGARAPQGVGVGRIQGEEVAPRGAWKGEPRIGR